MQGWKKLLCQEEKAKRIMNRKKMIGKVFEESTVMEREKGEQNGQG